MVEIDTFRAEIKGLSKEQLTEIQRALRLEKQLKYKKKGLNLYGYISEEHKKFVPLVMDYLQREKMIKNKTIYNMTTVAVKLLIKSVRDNISESGQHPRTP